MIGSIAELLSVLEYKAKTLTLDEDSDDFSPYDACGGNCDDAYFMGLRDGQIEYARLLLKELGY